MSTPLDHFQDDLVARVEGEALFADTVLIQERRGSAGTQVDQALAGEVPATSGKFGRFMVIEMPLRKPEEIAVRVAMRVIPKFFETGTDAHETLWALSDRLEQLFDEWSNGAQTLQVRGIVPFSEAGVIGYDAEIYWTRSIERPTSPELPRIATTGSTVTISCATPGAAIHYTVDGTYPKATATLYAGPFQAAGGTLIRAIAYVAGQPGSNAARRRVN